MTRFGLFTAVLIFIGALHLTDRVIAGIVQCQAAQTCPE